MNSVIQLLSSLDKFANNSKVQQIEPLNHSSLVFFKMRRLYEDEKRKKKLKDIESKPQVFTLARKPSERRNQYSVPYQKSLISPQIQNSILYSQDVYSLIRILRLVSGVSDTALLRECILRKISQLKTPEEVLKAFTKIIYCPAYLKNGQVSYQQIERPMIKIILNINMQECSPDKAVSFVRALPFATESTLELLSHFLQEISDPAAIDTLYDIFMKLFPPHPNEEQIRYLMRVSSHKAVEQVYDLNQQGLIDFHILEEQAKTKLKRIPKMFNERGKAMLSFVFFVAAHGGEIWTDIIEWETTAPAEYKSYLKERAQSIVEDRSISFDYLLIILIKLTSIDYQSEIADIFFNHVINLKDKELLNTLYIRKFLASKLLYKLNLIKNKAIDFKSTSLAVIFSKDLNYTDVLLELLENDVKSKEFYSYFLESDQNDKPLFEFLDVLVLKRKAKFKTFFVKFLNNTGGLLAVGQNKLLKYFMDKMSLELSYAALKEMSSKSPALYYMLFLIHWLKKFKGMPNFSLLRSCIIRNVNIVLLRPDLELSKQFLHDLNKMRKEELNPQENMRILSDVSKARRDLIEAMPVPT